MTRFDSGLAPLFWNTLFECLTRKSECTPGDNNVLIASPWLTDVELTGCRWPSNGLDSISSGRPPSTLVDVLGLLVNAGYEVDVVLAAREGKFLGTKSASIVDNETRLIAKASSLGVRCSFKADFHSKELSTPFANLSGSANWTNNGLWNMIENIEFKHRDRPSDATEYVSDRTTILRTYAIEHQYVVNQTHLSASDQNEHHPIHEIGIIDAPSEEQALLSLMKDEEQGPIEKILDEKSDIDAAAVALLDIAAAIEGGESTEQLMEQARLLLRSVLK